MWKANTIRLRKTTALMLGESTDAREFVPNSENSSTFPVPEQMSTKFEHLSH